MLSSRVQVLGLLALLVLSLLALLGYLQDALVACPGSRTTCVLILLLLLHMYPNTTTTYLQHARVAHACADVC